MDSTAVRWTGFLVFLGLISVAQGLRGSGVTCTPTHLCALEGSTVQISCSYRSRTHKVVRRMWFAKGDPSDPVDLGEDLEYSSRVQYHRKDDTETLTITNVTESDSTVYSFRFTTTQSADSFIGSPGVYLTVTNPELQVKKSSWTTMDCYSPCSGPFKSFIWYKNGEKVGTAPEYRYTQYSSLDVESISCALIGYEDFPSPPSCIKGQRCNKVLYTERKICAAEGSSVNISCIYNSYEKPVASKLWFRPDHMRSTYLLDLRKDSRVAARVKVFERKEGHSTLVIRDLRRSDSAEYRFKFTTNKFTWTMYFPGTSLTVTALQVQVIRGAVHLSSTKAKLKCHSGCHHASRLLYTWFKNQKKVMNEDEFYQDWFNSGDVISCALKGQEDFSSPPVYGPQRPSVSVSPSGEILEGLSVTLTCSTDANPAATYTWYKEGEASPVASGQNFIIKSIQSSDSGQYHCKAQNRLGQKTSAYKTIDVRYGPKRPSVSVSPSGEIVEGRSVTLTCSTDANPAANYTWYKGNQSVSHGPDGTYHLSSIRPENGGIYSCMSENQHGHTSSPLSVEVQYGPKSPSVSVSPSGEIKEGSSVTLTCSTDANPAANYTWYKEGEDSPVASGQNFTISDVRPEHSGNYSCKTQNIRGHHKTSVILSVARSLKSTAAGVSTAVILLLLFLFVFILIRKKKISRPTCEAAEGRGSSSSEQQRQGEDQGQLHYASIQFHRNQEELLYANVTPAMRRDLVDADGDATLYSEVKFHQGVRAANQESDEPPVPLYSTINKIS